MKYPASYTGRPAGEMELEHRAVMDAMPMASRCLFCGHTESGTVGVVRQAMLQHRVTVHPDLVPSKRRRGSQPGSFARNVSVWRDEQQKAEAMVAVRERQRTTHFDSEAVA